MVEKFELKRCPTVVVLKIISFLLSLAVMIAFVFAFYPMPEKYDTEADVRKSRAFDAIVDATKEVLKSEYSNYNYDQLFVENSFLPYKIAYIYEAAMNGYNIYSKIDYTVGFNDETKTAYCKTWCGDTWYKQGNHMNVKFGIETEIITEGEYNASDSLLISSEQEYNDLAVSAVYWAIQ